MDSVHNQVNVDSVHINHGEVPDEQERDGGRAATQRALVTAAEWFGGGQRIAYDPESARVLTEQEAAAAPGALRVFERVAAAGPDADPVWLTLLPGFPDGSYGWAQVDRMLGDDCRPGCTWSRWGRATRTSPGTTPTPLSSAPTWSGRCGGTMACAAPCHLVRLHVAGAARTAAPPAGAGGRTRCRPASDRGGVHGERRPVRRRSLAPVAGHAAAAHPAGGTGDAAGAAVATGVRRGDDAGPHVLPRLPTHSAGTRRAVVGGHPAGRSGVPAQCRGIRQRAPPPRAPLGLAAIARDLDGTVALYVGGSDEDPYEHRQIPATRARVPQARVLTFPGGHLTTSEHPDLLAAAIRDIAARHGVGTPATAHR